MIESDIALERFDQTLQKYRSPYTFDDSLSLIEIWDRYVEWKRPQVSQSTITKDYKKTRNHILTLPTQSLARASEIRNWLEKNLSPNAARRCLTQIKAASAWALGEQLTTADPLAGIKIRTRAQRGERREPFTKRDREMIYATFRDQFPHYLPYVKFLFLTGCRTSEANGLLWGDVGFLSRKIRFQRVRVSRQNQRDHLKTQAAREFPINDQLLKLLRLHHERSGGEALTGNDLIWLTPNGAAIDAHNFLNKVWKPLVSSLPMPYRPQYATRHTFISESLAAGVPVATLAAWVGNSARTIYQNYAGDLDDVQPPTL